MKRQQLVLFALSAMLVCTLLQPVFAVGGGGRGHGIGRGRGFGRGFGGVAVGVDNGCDMAELYRELYNNLPYFALHPPVYYSYPVPRTYGYSPFAYPPGVMTPEIVGEPQPVTFDNPYVPTKMPASTEVKAADRSADISRAPEPLVILNPFVSPTSNVAKNGL